ncbi:MAG: hypothetical protein M1309_03825 [Actinobacteria bacterium]|nr:hypothetical protein [Actinomycetota bacterium]
MDTNDYRELELALRKEAAEAKAAGEAWPADEVSRRLAEVADALAAIRRRPETGINASMGKRSGSAQEDV